MADHAADQLCAAITAADPPEANQAVRVCCNGKVNDYTVLLDAVEQRRNYTRERLQHWCAK